MKFFYSLLLLPSTLFISACGQTGPLYLPTEPPPIHVEKDKDATTTAPDAGKSH